jgi:hypothetical protein
VDHHARYGMRAWDEIDRANFVGLVYAVDRPVALGVIQKALERNLSVLTERGNQNRRDAAIAADSQIAEAYRGSGLVPPAVIERGASEFEMTEVKTTSNPSPEMGEQRIRVDRSGTVPEPRRGRRGRAALSLRRATRPSSQTRSCSTRAARWLPRCLSPWSEQKCSCGAV